jgi:hypothetical protein
VSTTPIGYELKSSFDGVTPCIKGNALTTSFKAQADRESFKAVYVPGIKSLK